MLYEEAWAEAVLESRFGPVVATSAPADPPVELPREVLQPYVGSYAEGVSYLTVAWDGEALTLRMPGEAALSRLVFTGEHTAYVAEGPKASHRLTLHPAEGVKSAWIEFADPEGSGAAGGYFDFNDSNREPPGDVGDRYDELVGPYEVIQWGQPNFQLSIEKKNGCIHIGGMRMTEHLPGLFLFQRWRSSRPAGRDADDAEHPAAPPSDRSGLDGVLVGERPVDRLALCG